MSLYPCHSGYRDIVCCGIEHIDHFQPHNYFPAQSLHFRFGSATPYPTLKSDVTALIPRTWYGRLAKPYPTGFSCYIQSAYKSKQSFLHSLEEISYADFSARTYGNYIISVGVLSMMGYQVEAAFSAVCRTTSTIRSPRGFPPAAKCSEIFIRLFPHTKYCVPFSACITCPVRGVKISLSLFAIQCPPYSVFKVQCRTEAAKISAYIYHLSFTVCRC